MNRLRLAACHLAVASAVIAVSGCESRRIGAASWESLELEIVDRDSGAPVAGIVCSIQTGARVVARRETDVDGRVVLTQSIPEANILEIDDPEGAYAPQRVELEEAGHHRIELRRAARAALRVVGAGDAPLEGAEVAVWSPGGTIRRHRLGDEGRWTFGPLAPGSSKLVVSAPGHAAVVLDARIDASHDAEPADLKSVRLFPGGTTVVGRVDSKPARRPQSAVLRFSGAGARAAIRSDGRFRLEGLPDLQRDPLAGGAMLVLLRDGEEVYARDLELKGSLLDVGTIEVE